MYSSSGLRLEALEFSDCGRTVGVSHEEGISPSLAKCGLPGEHDRFSGLWTMLLENCGTLHFGAFPVLQLKVSISCFSGHRAYVFSPSSFSPPSSAPPTACMDGIPLRAGLCTKCFLYIILLTLHNSLGERDPEGF